MNQQQIERSLTPCAALALDIVRNHAGINRYQGDDMGHGSLGQRVSDLEAMGFQFAIEYKEYVDSTGKVRRRVAHYSYLGWQNPAVSEVAR